MMESETSPLKKKTSQASSLLWGIDWNKELPIEITTQVYFRHSSYEEVTEFLTQYRDEILTPNERECRFLRDRENPSKVPFLKHYSDHFVFTQRQKIIGVFVANPLDWFSYYFRYINVLPQLRGSSLCELSVQGMIKVLKKAGVDKIICEVSPSNLNQIKRLTSLSFNITGQNLTERWGAMLQMTRYLDKECEETFIDNYCTGLRPQLNN